MPHFSLGPRAPSGHAPCRSTPGHICTFPCSRSRGIPSSIGHGLCGMNLDGSCTLLRPSAAREMSEDAWDSSTTSTELVERRDSQFHIYTSLLFGVRTKYCISIHDSRSLLTGRLLSSLGRAPTAFWLAKVRLANCCGSTASESPSASFAPEPGTVRARFCDVSARVCWRSWPARCPVCDAPGVREAWFERWSRDSDFLEW